MPSLSDVTPRPSKQGTKINPNQMASQIPHQTRPANFSDAQEISDLSTRVQSALTASGSLQELGPISPSSIQTSIRNGHVFILEFEQEEPGKLTLLGGGMIISPFAPEVGHGSWAWEWGWGVDKKKKLPPPPGKKWYLHSLMLEPAYQGQGLGLYFLKEALRQLEIEEGKGTVVLACWAGNEKLRHFYEKAGFGFLGVFPERDYEVAVFAYKMSGTLEIHE